MQVVVARIGRAHGIRGAVSVEVRTDEPELRLAVGSVLTTEPESVGPLTVAHVREHSGRLLLQFAEVNDRTAAEGLRGTLLVVDVAPDVRPEDPDEYYDRQLLGLAVVTAQGEPLGEVAEVVHLPGQEVLAVRRPGGGELLVPFVRAIVPEVDLEGGQVVVAPPPGLLELATDSAAAPPVAELDGP